MDVILLKDVEKVGLRGDVVSVSRGYMRNYLQPRKLAELAAKSPKSVPEPLAGLFRECREVIAALDNAGK